MAAVGGDNNLGIGFVRGHLNRFGECHRIGQRIKGIVSVMAAADLEGRE